MIESPSFTAIIRSLNKESTIGLAIESVQQQSEPGCILVVDSGSTDRTVEIARSLGARVIEIDQATFTYGRAINIGVQESTTEFVLVLSAHCRLPTNRWAQDALAILRSNPGMAGLNGVATHGDGDEVLTRSSPEGAMRCAKVSGTAMQTEPWFSFSGFSNHGSMIRREVAMDFPFNEDMAACEDKEWANRVTTAGRTVGFVAGMPISGLHRRRAGFRDLYRRAEKESEALSRLSGRPITSIPITVKETTLALRYRDGFRKFAFLRPANITEALGRISGSRKAAHTKILQDPRTSSVRDKIASALDGTHGTVDLLNVPLHDNCGDSAIWLGQLTILASIPGAKVRSRYTNILHEIPPASNSRPAIAIVRGGGYFGELWPAELHAFEDAMAHFAGSTVIFMPQSIGYLGTETAERIRAAIAAHGDVVLMLRDARSFQMATALFEGARTMLAPDSAHALTPNFLRKVAGRPDSKLAATRVIARHDTEGDGSLARLAAAGGADVLDFVGVAGLRRNAALRWAHELVRARFPSSVSSLILNKVLSRTRVYDLHAKGELRRALQQIVGAEHIITDRLHAAILASTLGIHTTIVDTGYGKLEAYFQQWPSEYVHLVRDVATALERLGD